MYHYAANNPVRYIDPDGNKIQAIYLGGVGAKLIVGGDISVGIAWDDNGNIALAITGSVGIGKEAEIEALAFSEYIFIISAIFFCTLALNFYSLHWKSRNFISEFIVERKLAFLFIGNLEKLSKREFFEVP